MFTQSTCNGGTHIECRTYNTFFSRRYFMIAYNSNHASSFNFQVNLKFPQSKEMSSSYYTTYIGYTQGGWDQYDHVWTGSLSMGQLDEAQPTLDYGIATYSSILQGYRATLSVVTDLSGYTIYSNRRTTGAFKNSFLRLTMSGFTSLYGCGVVQWGNMTPTWSDNAIYCNVVSSNRIEIRSNFDYNFTGLTYITFSTDSVPSSTSYQIELIDRWHSSSDYAAPVERTLSFSRSHSNTLMQPTSIKWRRQAYKQLRSDTGPVRLTLQNQNYQYVSTYSMSTYS